MMILQYKFNNVLNDNEYDIIPGFGNWICQQICTKINTKLIRRKIQLRINYLYTVPWIQWTKHKYLDVDMIMNTIFKAIYVEQYRKNTWRIRINSNINIPNTNTSIDRLVRFLEFGDINHKSINMFNNIKQYYNNNKLDTLYNMYCLNNLGYYTNTYIITT